MLLSAPKGRKMGVNWSDGRKVTVKNEPFIVVSAAMPASKNETEELFTLWKNKKDDIRNDGFRIGKNKYKNFAWEISYWHKITETSMEGSKSGAPLWRVEFNKKVLKWKTVMQKFKEVMSEQVDIDDDDADGDETPTAPEVKVPTPKTPVPKTSAPKPAATKGPVPKAAAPKPAAAKSSAPVSKATLLKSAPAAVSLVTSDDFSEGSGDEINVELDE